MVAALAAAAPGASPAQPRSDVPAVSEKQLLDRMDRVDPRLAVLAARIEAARAATVEARRHPNPTLALDRESVSETGQPGAENFVRLGVPLSLSGARGQRIEAAEAGVEAARAISERDRTLLRLEALDIFVDAAAARLRVEGLRLGRTALETVSAAVRARSSAGDASGYDQGRLEVELGNHDDLLSEAELALEAGRRALGRLMGQPGDRVDAADGLSLPVAPPPSAQLAARALESRGDYQAALARGRQAAHELAAGRRGWVPGLILSGGVKTAEVGGETAVGYLAGLTLSLPILDHGQAERARARAHGQQAQAEARALEREVPAALRAAYDRLRSRVAQAERYDKQQLGRIDRLVRQAEVSYREGERPVFELLDAYRTARETRQRAIELRREARRSEIDLWRVLGTKPEARGTR